MPAHHPFSIASIDSGLIKKKNAYAIPEEAYANLENAYVFRGRLRRRRGFSKLGRFQRDFSLTAGINTIDSTTTTINLLTELAITEANASIVPGTAANPIVITVAAPGSEVLTDDDGDGTLTPVPGTNITAATINYETGVITITTANVWAASALTITASYYPCLPVMGLNFYETNAVNQEITVGFDTVYAYQYDRTTELWVQMGTSTWQGSNSQFFWAKNYWNTSGNKILWATNFNSSPLDPIRYWDSLTWTDFLPAIDAGATTFMHQAKILIPYKGRLVALNTMEGAALPANPTAFQQRARWSQTGDPTDQVDGWRSDVRGFGGFVDAPTSEQIMSASFIRDLLVVRFERSTWALRYTGNKILPFVWERISIEMGADSTFSDVQFDEGILSVGDKGITSCDGNFVQRIDLDIPDEVFNFHNENNGPLRVHGIRDYFNRLVYWTFPNDDRNETFPNRMLVFNYEQKAWAFFRDSFTALGIHWIVNDVTWASLGISWADYPETWSSARLQSDFQVPIAGNQQGYTVLLNSQIGNDPSLHISDLTRTATDMTVTSPNHNLENGQWIILRNILGDSNDILLNDRPFKITEVVTDTFVIQEKPRFTITAITQAASAVVTAAGNSMEVGDEIEIKDVAGMVEINNLRGKVTARVGSDITVDIDTRSFTAYSAGGFIQDLSGLLENVIQLSSAYTGLGEIEVMSNFIARSKKFNMMETGSSSYLAHIDFLADQTEDGEIACEIYADYSDATPVNVDGDEFFNSSFETSPNEFSVPNNSKEWKRFFCNLDAQFFQYQLTFNDRIMASEQRNKSDVEIGALVIWSQKGGRLTT